MTAEPAFRPVGRADYPLLRQWFAAPHVRAFWGPPEAEIALIDAEMNRGDTAMLLVFLAGQPVGYVQDWCPHHAGEVHLADEPRGARAVDCILGAADLLGRGAARHMVRARAEALTAGGAPAVVADPACANARAIAMYRAAGFAPFARRADAQDTPVQLMRYDPGAPAPRQKD